MREDFFSNVRDYIEIQAKNDLSEITWLEQIIRIVFDTKSRYDIIAACNYSLIGYQEDTGVEAALNSQLPAVLSQVLSTI
jgi:hypothetical protein